VGGGGVAGVGGGLCVSVFCFGWGGDLTPTAAAIHPGSSNLSPGAIASVGCQIVVWVCFYVGGGGGRGGGGGGAGAPRRHTSGWLGGGVGGAPPQCKCTRNSRAANGRAPADGHRE